MADSDLSQLYDNGSVLTAEQIADGDLFYVVHLASGENGSMAMEFSQLASLFDAAGAAATAQSAAEATAANASNLTSGTVATARLGSGTADASHYLRGDGSWEPISVFVATSTLGQANGVATLDSSGRLAASQIPASLVGAVQFQSAWNASTNTPTIPAASSSNAGQYYIVSVAGTTSINGFSNWEPGDWLVSDGSTWTPIPGAQTLATVAVTGAYSDLSGLPTLGTAAALNVGTSANEVVQLDGSAKLPAVDGSQLTNLPGGSGLPSGGSDGQYLQVIDGVAAWGAGSTATLPLQTGSDPASVIKNAAGDAIFSTDSGSNPLITDINGAYLLEIDTNGDLNLNSSSGAVICEAPNFNVQGTLNANGGAVICGAGQQLSFFGAPQVSKQSLSLSNVNGTGDDGDINNNFAAILSLLQAYGLSA